jgi:hypothetical protein
MGPLLSLSLEKWSNNGPDVCRQTLSRLLQIAFHSDNICVCLMKSKVLMVTHLSINRSIHRNRQTVIIILYRKMNVLIILIIHSYTVRRSKLGQPCSEIIADMNHEMLHVVLCRCVSPAVHKRNIVTELI